jgi:TRAP-type mannitol/chloroaromatic compound transport system permease small subunit
VKALQLFARAIDAINERIGRTVAWLALLMVLTQFVVVVMRYVFGIGSVVMQESIVYMHATVFLVAAGYTLLHNGHVRCDIFYADATPKRKALVDIFGVFVFLLPMSALIGWIAWPYVVSAWAVLEGSPEGGLGIPGVYLLKSTILVFAVLVVLQGLALAVHSLVLLFGVETTPGAHEASGGTPE